VSRIRPTAWVLHAGALLAYLAAALVLSFPLVTHFTTHFPGTAEQQDVFLFLWNNWWIHHAVTALHSKPYLTNFIYAPFVTDLRFTSSGLLYGLLSIPIFALFGPVVVLNIQVLVTAVLNGYAAFILTRHLTKRADVGICCGLALASTPAIDFHLSVGRPSCAALWPAIFMLYFFIRLLDKPGNRATVGLVVCAVATLLGDQEAALFAGLWLIVLAVHAAATPTGRRSLVNPDFLIRSAIVAVVAAVPAYVLYFTPFMRTAGYTTPGPIEAVRYSYPVSLLWTPSLIWRVYGIVLPAGLLASIAFVRRLRALVPWAIGSLIFLILSFGPVVMGTNVPLLFSLVATWPGFEQFRTPYRFQIGASLGLTVLMGIVLAWLLETLRAPQARRVLAGFVVLAAADLLAHRLISGFPIQTMQKHALYDTIARDPLDYVILEVPVGVRTGTDRIGPGEALSFYQPIHHKRLISGSTSRMPAAALDYYRASPAIMLLAAETPPAGDPVVDLRRLIAELKIGYVVIHRDMLLPQRLREALDLLEGIDTARRVDADAELIAFRIAPPSSFTSGGTR
jgi:hypothetical protein